MPGLGGDFRLSRVRCILAGALMTAGLALDAAGAAPVAQDRDPRPTLTAKALTDRPLVLKGDKRPVYVLLQLGVRETTQEAKARPPVNLALVLDRSGSMADRGKLEYLKAAAARILDELEPSDVLSIVEYDDRITVLWPAGPVGSPRLVKGLIDGLTPRGSTDLVGGMMEGVEQAKSAAAHHIAPAGSLARVLLLSDGLANRGITDPARIRALVGRAKADGVPISTLGLGRDYDEDLMQAIAENAGGRYYYIESPDQIAGIFAQEMNTLFHLAARTVHVDIRPAEGVGGAEILGFEGRTAELGDLASGEKRALLLRLDLDAQSVGMQPLGTLNISYVDAEGGERHNSAVNLGVEITSDAGRVARSQNPDVAVEAVLAETERGQKEAVKRLQAGDPAGAQRQMSQLAQAVEKSQALFKDKRLEKKLEALSIERKDMAEAALAPAESSEYLKRSKQRLYQAKTGKRALSQLQEGDGGYEVERLQEALTKAGYYRGPVDGVFSASVTQAVKAFQKAEKIGPDGIAGPSTMKELGLY
jgi:Ca-activated chloride channel homolog